MFKKTFLLAPLLIFAACQRSSESNLESAQKKGGGSKDNHYHEEIGEFVTSPVNSNAVDEAVDGNEPWVAVVEDKINRKQFIQTGPTRIEAIEVALSLCDQRAGYDKGQTCVLVRSLRYVTLPRDTQNFIGTQWMCLAVENDNPAALKNRDWYGIARTEPNARKTALEKCGIKGGVGCMIKRCSTADGAKAAF